MKLSLFRSSLPEMFSKKDVLQAQNKPTGERLCRSMISIKSLCKFIEIKIIK